MISVGWLEFGRGAADEPCRNSSMKFDKLNPKFFTAERDEIMFTCTSTSFTKSLVNLPT